MNENQRIRVSVPISGIDTSTPDALVPDGKCEKLHNLRFDGSSWRNVLEGPDLHARFTSDYPLKLVYQHPAKGDSSYIAVSTEPTYSFYRDEAKNEIIYLEAQEGSDIAKAYRKKGDKYTAANDIIVNFDHETKTFYKRSEDLVDNLGVYEDDGNPGGDYILTLSDKPKVGNAIYTLDRNSLLISEIGVIREVGKSDDLYQLRVYRYNAEEEVDIDVRFLEYTEATIPVKSIVAVVPPHSVLSIDVVGGDINSVQPLCVYDPSQQFSVHHFGNVLFVRRPELLTFTLKDDKYNFTDFSRIRFQCREINNNDKIGDSFVAKGLGLPRTAISSGSTTFKQGNCIYYPLATKSRDQFLLKQFEGDLWRGEICYFLAARMEDGTVISVSPLFLTGNNPSRDMPIVIQEFNGEKVYCLYGGLKFNNNGEWDGANSDPTDAQLVSSRPMLAYSPLVNFTVHTDYDNALIHDIALYSTRIIPSYNLGLLPAFSKDYWSSADSRRIVDVESIFTDTAKELSVEPFYLVDSISWVDYKSGKRSFHLTYPTLNRAIGNPTYEPNANIAPIIDFLSAKEYNNSLHFGATTRLLPEGFVYRNEMIQKAGIPFPSINDTLYEGYTPNDPDEDRDYETDYTPDDDYGDLPDYDDGGFPEYDDDGGDYDPSMYSLRMTRDTVRPIKDVVTRIIKANKAYYAVTEDIVQSGDDWHIPSIISYADANADSIMFCTGLAKGDNGVEYKLSPINAINFAFHIIKGQSTKFNNECKPSTVEERTSLLRDIIPNRVFKEPNKLFVSATNNCFNFPFDQVYGLGTQSNQILAVNSAAIEMSDAKFGEMPLYAFTSEGVFALHSGDGVVLYSNIIPINYDRIINPCTLAINYNLIYITEEGVKSISSNGTALLSKALNDAEDKPLLDYLRDAELLDFKPYNELILHRPESDYAFVLALKDGYWATRDFNGSSIGADKLYLCDDYGSGKSHTILDLSKRETGESQSASIKTRPLKFGSHEFKRLETFIPRLRAVGGVELTIRFYGSNDRVNWALLREVRTDADVDLTLRRFPFSARYIYVEILIDPIDVGAGFDISSFDIEYYNRFLSRLR